MRRPWKQTSGPTLTGHSRATPCTRQWTGRCTATSPTTESPGTPFTTRAVPRRTSRCRSSRPSRCRRRRRATRTWYSRTSCGSSSRGRTSRTWGTWPPYGLGGSSSRRQRRKRRKDLLVVATIILRIGRRFLSLRIGWSTYRRSMVSRRKKNVSPKSSNLW